MTKGDGIGLAAVLGVLGGLLAFRAAVVEPRDWAAACMAASAPAACLPRAALLWLQHWQLWGAGALALGAWSLLGAPLAVRVAAVALGAMAVANYNATAGMFGLALGAWAWIVDRDGRGNNADRDGRGNNADRDGRGNNADRDDRGNNADRHGCGK